jgi:hypothetical protein
MNSNNNTDDEVSSKIQNSTDGSEEELMEESANEEKEELEKIDVEISRENDFYKKPEKDQKIALREGLKFNIRRNFSLDENINIDKETKQEKKERIIKDVRELLLKKKNPGYKRNLFKNE